MTRRLEFGIVARHHPQEEWRSPEGLPTDVGRKRVWTLGNVLRSPMFGAIVGVSFLACLAAVISLTREVHLQGVRIKTLEADAARLTAALESKTSSPAAVGHNEATGQARSDSTEASIPSSSESDRAPQGGRTSSVPLPLWMTPAAWERIRVGMAESQVLELLGQPTQRDVGEVYATLDYQGFAAGSGHVGGKVWIALKDDRVAVINKPLF